MTLTCCLLKIVAISTILGGPSIYRTSLFNLLTPNDPYMGRTAPLTSKRCILYIYSTNTGTEYFKHALYSPFFFLSSKCSLFHNANLFGSFIIHILYTGCAEIKKKNNSGAKGLKSKNAGRKSIAGCPVLRHAESYACGLVDEATLKCVKQKDLSIARTAT